MEMPLVIQAYFEADRSRDSAAFVALFAPDAIVRDEGASRVGHDEIRKWWLAAKEKYDHYAEPFEALAQGDAMKVRATVTGSFPGSPVTLEYDFRIVDGRIAALAIG